jgi:hypothetical protein
VADRHSDPNHSADRALHTPLLIGGVGETSRAFVSLNLGYGRVSLSSVTVIVPP